MFIVCELNVIAAIILTIYTFALCSECYQNRPIQRKYRSQDQSANYNQPKPQENITCEDHIKDVYLNEKQSINEKTRLYSKQRRKLLSKLVIKDTLDGSIQAHLKASSHHKNSHINPDVSLQQTQRKKAKGFLKRGMNLLSKKMLMNRNTKGYIKEMKQLLLKQKKIKKPHFRKQKKQLPKNRFIFS